MFEVLVSAHFAKEWRALPAPDRRRIKAGLAKLREDSRAPRAGADIKPLVATDPPKHRLRVGSFRVIYVVEGRTVRVLDLFRRERGYRE